MRGASESSGPVRVLQIIDSLARAGAEQSLVAAAPHLLTAGVDLEVAYLVDRPDDLRPELAAAGVPVHSLASPGAGRRDWFARCVSLIAARRPDVVHTTIFEADLVGRLAAARCRLPCVSSLVNTAYGPAESVGLPWARVRAAQAADAATGLLVTRWHALTEHVAEVMSRRLLIPRRRIEVIPRSRDVTVLGARTSERRLRTRAALGVPEGAPLMLAVGRQAPQKGLDVLLRAVPAVLARHPELRVVLAGRDGTATPDLLALRADLGLESTVTPLGVRRDVADLMVAADVLAFPSRWEGAAGTLIEAMALELPIVATRLPTLRRTVDDSTAVLVPVDAVDAFAAGLLDTLADPAAARQRAVLGRARFAADFSMDAVVGRTADLYRRVARTVTG